MAGVTQLLNDLVFRSTGFKGCLVRPMHVVGVLQIIDILIVGTILGRVLWSLHSVAGIGKFLVHRCAGFERVF